MIEGLKVLICDMSIIRAEVDCAVVVVDYYYYYYYYYFHYADLMLFLVFIRVFVLLFSVSLAT